LIAATERGIGDGDRIGEKGVKGAVDMGVADVVGIVLEVGCFAGDTDIDNDYYYNCCYCCCYYCYCYYMKDVREHY